WPFAAGSPWNQPVGTGLQFAPTSDPRNAELQSPWTAINTLSWSMPVYLAANADPVRTVTSPAGSWQYRIPDTATAAAPSDRDRRRRARRHPPPLGGPGGGRRPVGGAPRSRRDPRAGAGGDQQRSLERGRRWHADHEHGPGLRLGPAPTRRAIAHAPRARRR